MRPGRLVPIREDAPGLVVERILAVRAAGAVPLVGDPRWSAAHWQSIVDAAEAATPDPDIAWAAVTSGSSGTPRIVLRTAASWSDSFPVIAGLLGAGPDDAVALPAPPVSSLTQFSLAHAADGGPRALLPRGRALVAVDFADATCFHGTPHALRALLDAGAPPRLRAALVGGSHLDPALRARVEAAGVRVVSYYGAAELSFVAADHGEGLTPLPGVEAEIRGGELFVRSPFAAARYLDGPLRRQGDWIASGDRAELQGGRLRLLGRVDDAILSASATIVPEEVEAQLRTLPGVRDAAVIGLPHRRLGALIAAVIEPDPALSPVIAELRAAAALALAPAHRPRRWYTGVLPRTAAGKPARARIAREVAAGEWPRLG